MAAKPELTQTSFLQKAAFFFYALLFVSFLLVLGMDSATHDALRMQLALATAAIWLLSFLARKVEIRWRDNPALWFFMLFFLYECGRAFWAYRMLEAGQTGLYPQTVLQHQIAAPRYWAYYAGFFMISTGIVSNRKSFIRFQWLTVAVCLFIALNALPALLVGDRAAYVSETGRAGFYLPFFYFHDLIYQYILGVRYHANWAGEVVAVGFFAALSLFLNALPIGGRPAPKKWTTGWVNTLALSGVSMALLCLTTVLFYSRGTILSFVAGLFIFGVLFSAKYRSAGSFSVLIVTVLLAFGSLALGGNFDALRREFRSLEQEIDMSAKASRHQNVEGARRAFAMAEDYPVVGVGTHGFGTVSPRYSDPNERNTIGIFYAMCHYLQIWAEEGWGSVLYYLFLLSYFLTMLVFLFRTRSVYEFVMRLSLFSMMAVIFIHAIINFFLKNYSMSMMVYMLMGLSLGIGRHRRDA